MNTTPPAHATLHLLRHVLAAILSAALFALTACSSTPGDEETTVFETADGAVIVDTFTTTATVTAVDAANRKVTLQFPGGTSTTYQAGPEMVNFGQIQVGDRVRAKVTEEVAVFLGRGEPPSASAGAAVALAPVGAKPGGVLVETRQITARVTSVDVKKRRVGLELPDGSVRKVRVGSRVNLAAVNTGDSVTVQVSEGLAVSVERP